MKPRVRKNRLVPLNHIPYDIENWGRRDLSYNFDERGDEVNLPPHVHY